MRKRTEINISHKTLCNVTDLYEYLHRRGMRFKMGWRIKKALGLEPVPLGRWTRIEHAHDMSTTFVQEIGES